MYTALDKLQNQMSNILNIPILHLVSYSLFDSDFHLVNKSLPWDYAFRFVIEEISNINDKSQVGY